jgi:hypothetical protein
MEPHHFNAAPAQGMTLSKQISATPNPAPTIQYLNTQYRYSMYFIVIPVPVLAIAH